MPILIFFLNTQPRLLWYDTSGQFTESHQDTYPWYEFEYYIFKITAASFKGQWCHVYFGYVYSRITTVEPILALMKDVDSYIYYVVTCMRIFYSGLNQTDKSHENYLLSRSVVTSNVQIDSHAFAYTLGWQDIGKPANMLSGWKGDWGNNRLCSQLLVQFFWQSSEFPRKLSIDQSIIISDCLENVIKLWWSFCCRWCSCLFRYTGIQHQGYECITPHE